MNSDKSSKAITIALVVIILGIFICLGIFGFQLLRDKNKEEAYTNAANEFEDMIISSKGSGKNNNGIAINSVDVPERGNKKMGDYDVIGTIEIPKVGLKSAILDRTTTKSLEIAITFMYSTSGLNKPGTTVLYGHNYRNSLLFSRNDELVNGDIVKVLDKEGNKVTYEIYGSQRTTSTDTSSYARTAEVTGGVCELVLSTCTDDADKTDGRLLLFCKEKSREEVGTEDNN